MNGNDTLQLNLNYTYLIDFIQTKGSSLLTDEEFVKCISILRENLQPEPSGSRKQAQKNIRKARPSASIASSFRQKLPTETTPKPIKSSDLILMDALSRIEKEDDSLPHFSFANSIQEEPLSSTYIPPVSVAELPRFNF